MKASFKQTIGQDTIDRLPQATRNDPDARRQVRPNEATPPSIFRFLDLPAELRNNVYEFAAGSTAKDWPLVARRAWENPLRGKANKITKETCFPYLGLTHASTRIRFEFRSMWIDENRIALVDLEKYLITFFPIPTRRIVSARGAGFNPAGKLNILIRMAESRKICILRLLKMKAKFPDYQFTFGQCSTASDEWLLGLNQLINKKDHEWFRWIRGNRISQALLQTVAYPPGTQILLVVKERYASTWMKPTLNIVMPDGFLESMGLDGIDKNLSFQFAVCYT